MCRIRFVGVLACLFVPAIAQGSYVEAIVSFTPGEPYYEQAPIANILGPPDTGVVWTDVLGSIGHFGEVVVDMGEEGVRDLPGDDLYVWFGGWQEGSPERFEGFRLEASRNGSDYYLVSEVPLGLTVPSPIAPTPVDLDLSPSGLAFARYLRITDTGTDPGARGLELNAIEGRIPEPTTLSLLALGALALARRRKR